MPKKQLNKKEVEPENEPEVVLEEIEESQPEDKEEISGTKKKKNLTPEFLEHLKRIRVKALEVKKMKKEQREKAKQLVNAELELKSKKYDKVIEETNNLTDIKDEPKKTVKKVVKKIIQEESESEEEEEVIIVKKKKDKTNLKKPLTSDDKLKLVDQTAEERLKTQLKEDRINFLLNQIGAKI